jgi:hypothetical protein
LTLQNRPPAVQFGDLEPKQKIVGENQIVGLKQAGFLKAHWEECNAKQ